MKQYRIQRAAGRQQGPVTKLQIVLTGGFDKFFTERKVAQIIATFSTKCKSHILQHSYSLNT